MNWIQTSFLRSFLPDARYLVGVSGGRDSVALLHSLVERGYEQLIVCHLNHQLRGRSSDADARFVKKLAAKCDVDLEMGSTNVCALAAKHKMSIEVAAREARYKFFAQVARQRRTQTIFLAHHADDLIETFLINLFRGAGASGLSAIREISNRRIGDVDLTIVRPFLGRWRDEIDRYVRKHGLKFREDASNKNLAPLRNRIRRRIIPYLEKTLGRNIRQSIWRAATIAAEEENWIEDQLPDATDADLAVAKLRDLPVALQRREILKWLRARKIANVGFDVVEDVRSLLGHDAPVAKVNLPQDRHVRRRAGKIFIE
ncbi:MAG: tRNA lysidine(34) synthetase TilS [Verrucomicrobia bacterium]|nr:MAG: tRNA lysidine(34) synthetase TilS [Verrucomicrobiota bacterium]PYK91879.1 MAG: tRNA lysidine(34) synthetase TilS [Verrucomicrobiota bacterium]